MWGSGQGACRECGIPAAREAFFVEAAGAIHGEKIYEGHTDGDSKGLRPRSERSSTAWQSLFRAQKEKYPFPHSSAPGALWVFIHPWERLSAFDLRPGLGWVNLGDAGKGS